MKHRKYIHQENTALSISTDPALMDVQLIHQFLVQQSYWAKDADIAETSAILADDLCFGLFYKNEQIGFASDSPALVAQ